MKRLLAVSLFLIAVSIFGLYHIATANDVMPDITLTTPIAKPANTQIIVQEITLGRGPVIKAVYNEKNADGSLGEQLTCTLEDWNEITVPASCDDVQWDNQTDCEADGDIWTAATVVAHTDLTDKFNAVVGAGQVGNKYIAVIADAVDVTCRGTHYLNKPGTSD